MPCVAEHPHAAEACVPRLPCYVSISQRNSLVCFALYLWLLSSIHGHQSEGSSIDSTQKRCIFTARRTMVQYPSKRAGIRVYCGAVVVAASDSTSSHPLASMPDNSMLGWVRCLDLLITREAATADTPIEALCCRNLHPGTLPLASMTSCLIMSRRPDRHTLLTPLHVGSY